MGETTQETIAFVRVRDDVITKVVAVQLEKIKLKKNTWV